MTTDELRRALARVTRYPEPDQNIWAAWAVYFADFTKACEDESIGYIATLRALLEARELLARIDKELAAGELSAETWAKVRAFLAEGESA